jgi:hypothetical protein
MSKDDFEVVRPPQTRMVGTHGNGDEFLEFPIPLGTRDQSRFFLAKLRDAWDLHLRKSAGYSGHSNDVWVNFRTEHLGVPDELGIAVRLNDKFNRLVSLLQNPSNDQVNEPLEDLYRDIAAYCYIALCMRDERE